MGGRGASIGLSRKKWNDVEIKVINRQDFDTDGDIKKEIKEIEKLDGLDRFIMDDGSVFEVMHTQKDIMKYVDDVIWSDKKSNGGDGEFSNEDDSIFIQYKDGTSRYIGVGDSVENIKKTGIESVITSNAVSDVIYNATISKEYYGEKTKWHSWRSR